MFCGALAVIQTLSLSDSYPQVRAEQPSQMGDKSRFYAIHAGNVVLLNLKQQRFCADREAPAVLCHS